MKTLLIVLLALDVLLLIATIVLVAVRFKKSANAADIDEQSPEQEACACTCTCAECEEKAQEKVEEQPVEEVAEEAEIEAPVEAAEPVAEVEEEKAAPVISDIEGEEEVRRVPFAEKMIFMEKEKQAYYDAINNEMLTYRKVRARISSKGVSYRVGRQLVAKITVRGKTIKAHYALEVSNFNQNVYFQKDMSDVKAYEEVPFTVKVKSERGAKNALKLIAALAEAHGLEKKTRSTPVDSIEDLKVWVKSK